MNNESYNSWNCLNCEKKNTNLVFCSGGCKNQYYDNKKTELKGSN